MTGQTFTALIRYLTKTTSTTLTDADIVMLANVEKDNLAELIASNVDEGYFNVDEVRDLEADTRRYTFDSAMLKAIKYIAAKLDGTNWTYLTQTDFGYFAGRELPLLENTEIKSEFANKAKFLISGLEVWLLTGDDIIAVSEGLKLVTEVYPEDITTGTLSLTADISIPTSTTAVTLPRATHRVWAHMVSIAYKSSKDKPLPLTAEEKKLVTLLDDPNYVLYEKLKNRNAVGSFLASVPYDDGQDY